MRFRHHVFVCENRRDPSDPRGCCAARGGEAVREALKAELKRRGLKGSVRANGAGCLDACAQGPAVVVYPEGVWYGHVRPEDVPEIVERHLVGGEPVERLRLRALEGAGGEGPTEPT
jgi:(2Fe-2S) ferredoxin